MDGSKGGGGRDSVVIRRIMDEVASDCGLFVTVIVGSRGMGCSLVSEMSIGVTRETGGGMGASFRGEIMLGDGEREGSFRARRWGRVGRVGRLRVKSGVVSRR